MSDRAQMPIPVRVRNRRNRLMFTLPLTSLGLLLIGSVPIVARAQAQPPTPATDGTQPPADGSAPTELSPRQRTVLNVKILASDTGAPVSFATVRLTSETERPRSRPANSQGIAQFPALSDGTYSVVITAVGRKPSSPQTVVITLGQTSNIVVFLSPLGPIDLSYTGTVDLLDAHDYSISYKRDSRFIRDFPFDAGDHQNLNSLLLSVPGVAYDAGNNYFARGDGAVATSTLLDGTLMPGALMGRGAAVYSPSSIQSFRAITGNFAPEYTGSGLVLDLNTIPIPTARPTLDLAGRLGNYGSDEDYVNFGSRSYGRSKGAAGQSTGTKTFAGAPIGYVFALSQRFTNNTLDPAQPDQQTVANYGESDTAFGKMDFRLKNNASIDAVVNYAFGRTNMSDRTGLDSSYGSVGQGYGFAGTLPSGILNSQAVDGKSDLQKDYNLLTEVHYKRDMASGAKLVIAVGTNESSLTTISATPVTLNFQNLPANSSVEYRPFVDNDYQTAMLQADITLPPKMQHQYKAGIAYQDLDGHESYQLVPGSQIALDSLYALDPRLVASGGATDGSVDALGFPTYKYAGGTTVGATPVLVLHRTGSYLGAYAQDTWQFRTNLTLNYGVRLDSYSATTVTERFDPTNGGSVSEPGSVPSVSTSAFSPRINGVLEFPQGNGPRLLRFLTSAPTLARFGYNHLFAAPGMDQGNFIGNQAAEANGGTQKGTPAQPQTTDQIDLNIERQIGVRGKLRIGLYDKTIKNYLESEQLIPGLQNGLMAIFNQGGVVSDGTEVTFELLPGSLSKSRKEGIHAFLSYESSTTHPSDLHQFDNLGFATAAYFNPAYNGLFAPFVDGDQSDTLSFGISSSGKDGSLIGLSGYYGSGLYSSAVRDYDLPVRQNATRQGYSQLNLRYSTGPRFLKKTTAIQFEVSNLLNSKERIDYLGAFDGTRFQQGTKAFLSFTAHL